MTSSSTKDRILDAALASFASRGYEATSLDAVGKGLELTKQSILYWFPSKDALLEAVIARSADDLSAALETALRGAGEGWERVEAVVRSVFRLAARQPELLGFLREVGRLGPPAATQMTLALDPLVHRASSFLEASTRGCPRAPHPALVCLEPAGRRAKHDDALQKESVRQASGLSYSLAWSNEPPRDDLRSTRSPSLRGHQDEQAA